MKDQSLCDRRSKVFKGSKAIPSIAAILLCGVIACDHQPSKIDLRKKEGKPEKVPVLDAPKVEQAKPGTSKTEASPLTVLLDAPKFQLTDQTGENFGSDELDGCVWVANFMFTTCTATCPRQTAKFEELQQRAGRWPDWEKVRLVSFTVDPENDTVERLHNYADAHKADSTHWKFLTGARSDLWELSKDGFKLPVSKSVSDTSVPITHSPRFVLVDAKRRIRSYYDGLSDDDFQKLLIDLREVLSEPPPNKTETVHITVPKELFDQRSLEKRKVDQLAAASEFQVFHDFAFEDQLVASGIRFQNQAVADSARDFRQNHYDHANGIAVADVDEDGLHDLYFVNQVGGNELWRNLGNGRFENITEKAGVALKGRVSVSASFADTDNDGDSDLYVTTTRHGNAFFVNDGHGHFSDATTDSGLEYIGHSSTADFFDYDRDGRLDLFLTNVGVFTTDEIGHSGSKGNPNYPYYVGMKEAFVGHMFPERAERSILYHNEGKNVFRDVTNEAGILHDGWSGDATPLDANDDGWIDLYLANMQGNDEYYQNIEGKRFERRSTEVFPQPTWGGMCVKSFDYNNDGLMDLFITNMHADMWQISKRINGPQEKLKPPQDAMPEAYLRSRIPGKNVFGNGFYQKQGSDQFLEVSDQVNAENYWPWGHSVGDLNADGYQDIFITTCMNYPFRYQANSLLLNDRGKRFLDAEYVLGVEPRRDNRISTPWFELDCSNPDEKHKACVGQSGRVVVWGALGSRSSVIFDIDQDGDLDIVTNDFNSPPMVLMSNLSEKNKDLRFLKIQLQGTRSNKSSLGAKVQLTAEGKVYTQVQDGQSGYLSQSILPLYFGLGASKTVERVTIQWPSGGEQVLEGPINTNQQILIIEADPSKNAN